MLPRQFFSGTTYFVTRRTVQRTYFLRPSPQLNQIFLYCLACAAERFGVEVHAYCLMSNHMHLIVTDPGTKLPKFMHWLDLFVSKCVNAMLGRWGAMWEPESYAPITLLGDATIIEKIVYTLNNPVSAGLVRFGAQWPGCRSRPQDIGTREIEVERPTFFFSRRMPKKVRLRLVRPPCLPELEDAEVAEHIAERVSEKEKETQAEFDRKGRTFRGRKGVLTQSPRSSPTTHEPRRQLRPSVACRDKWWRIEWLQKRAVFLQAYREAWERFCAGARDVIFPAGTYLMRVQYGVSCHDPPG